MSTRTTTEVVPLATIVADERAQSRAAVDEDAVAEYAEAMTAGVHFPPLTVFREGARYWLADGFHRHAAALRAGHTDFKCYVRPGGLRDAILHSVRANATHGLRRTIADKRKAVSILLSDELVTLDPKTCAPWSNREIARRCAVDEGLVRKLRTASAEIRRCERSHAAARCSR